MADQAEAKAGKPVVQEIASTGDGRDITRPYVGPLAPNDDRVLAARGGGLEVYEEVLRDDQAYSCFQQRRLAVTSRELQVVAGGTDALSVKAADALRANLMALPFDRITDKMMHGRWYGYGITEMMWVPDGNQVVIDVAKVRRARRFAYDPQGNLKLRTIAQPLGELMPPQKFWTWSSGADNDDTPYGLGLAHWCYWPAYFKRNGMKFWLIFLEKYGMPTAVGKFGPNTSPADQNKLLQAAKAIATDSGIVIPDGMLLELLQAARSGTADYATLHDKMDAAMAKVILSQTMTTDDGASLAQGQVHFSVRQEVSKADGDELCESFNNGPARWLTEWNFPGAKTPVVRRNFETPEDLTARAARDRSIASIGFRPTLKYINETYGGEWVDAPPPLTITDRLTSTDGAAALAVPSFAEGGGRDDAIDQAVNEMLANWQPTMLPIRDQVRDATKNCTSFAEVLVVLEKLRPKLKTDALAASLESANLQALGHGIVGDVVERPKS